VESQEHEYQAVIDYFFDQSPKGTVMRHVEKVTSERIYGTRHDVWDVEADNGRWWVITNPMNVYPQEMAPTPSMEHVLALHIGLTARVMAREQMRAPVDGPVRDLTARTWRKFEQAAEALNEANEAEDFQAVGMRLRECLVAFAQETSPEVNVPEGTEVPKQGNFKGWAELLVQDAAPGSSAKPFRSYLRLMSREAWDLVVWLTHEASATRVQAEAAVDATSHVMKSLSLALITARRGEPLRCPTCGSYQVVRAYYRYRESRIEPDGYLLCEACMWEESELFA